MEDVRTHGTRRAVLIASDTVAVAVLTAIHAATTRAARATDAARAADAAIAARVAARAATHGEVLVNGGVGRPIDVDHGQPGIEAQQMLDVNRLLWGGRGRWVEAGWVEGGEKTEGRRARRVEGRGRASIKGTTHQHDKEQCESSLCSTTLVN